jgi:aspartyl-tRNA(Asn)/glutamyl-tRNA(Gln) amidotransferase subunit B
MQWETVIGLEVHAQLKTSSKLFSGSAATFGAEPNTQASFIDIALPGVLPVLNKAALNHAIRFGLAVDGKISPNSVFERKNYFYPDLPKGYQLSQLEDPIVSGGHIDIEVENNTKRIELTRAHLEEDAGKSIHLSGHSGIDLNRAGTPLLEIVTEPVMHSANEAIAYLKTLHTLVQYIGICDGNMQEGSFRCDVNLSIRKKGETTLGTRSEIKNLNSFRFIEKAIHYEIERHIDLIEQGESIQQETRLYDDKKGVTFSMRSKEEANDYRYFPCPDLLPVIVTEEMITKIKCTLPELPQARKERFIKALNLNEEDSRTLVQDKDLADYFESVLKQTNATPKMVSNWIKVELIAKLKKDNLSIKQTPITATHFANLLDAIESNTISGKIAKSVLETQWQTGQSADEIIKEQGLTQLNDAKEIKAIAQKILDANPTQVKAYLGGKDKLLGFFVGQVMKETKGKANPAEVNKYLLDLLKES